MVVVQTMKMGSPSHSRGPLSSRQQCLCCVHSHLARILNANVQPIDGIPDAGTSIAPKSNKSSSISQIPGNNLPF